MQRECMDAVVQFLGKQGIDMLMAFHAGKITKLFCNNSELEVRLRRLAAVHMTFVLDRNHGRIKGSLKLHLNNLLHTGLVLHAIAHPV